MTIPSNTVANPEILHLDIAQNQEQLKVSLASQCAGEMQTVRHVEVLDVPMTRIGEQCRRMVATLNRANRQGRLTTELLNRLKENGQRFRDELLSNRIKEQLNTTPTDQLIITLDDSLVHIPWELLHDGDRFLCQRFAMGRVVRTPQAVVANMSRPEAAPLQMLVLADPCADLISAYDEGIGIRDYMEDGTDRVWVAFRSQGITTDFIQSKVRHYDLVHFAGHADYDDEALERSGWRLSDGCLTAAEIVKMAGTGAMPALVFSNACQSGRSENRCGVGDMQDRIFGLANAFILSGVKHYIGTFWEVADESSRRFALNFYHHLGSGLSVGKAMQASRQSLMEQYGEENIIWASYLLYGDPATTYLPAAIEPPSPVAPMEKVTATSSPRVAHSLRAPEEVLRLSHRPGGKSSKFMAMGLGALALLVGFWLFFFGFAKDAHQYEQQALAAFSAGNYAQVESTCQYLQEKNPQRGLSYVLLGNVHFYKGEVEQARTLYENAMQAQRSGSRERAEALIGLGRIASETGRTEQALGFYRRASTLSPTNRRPYLAQAVLLEKQGKYGQAAAVLKDASAGTSNDPGIQALANQMETRAGQMADAARQQRIDEMIEALLSKDASDMPVASARPGVDQPLTFWVMDFEEKGYSLQEGAARLLASNISDQLLQQNRYQVVERALLDKLLGELQLSTSKLTDAQGALSLGRLVSARLMLSGRMVHSAPHTQVALRCIETETGRVIAMVNTTFDAQTPVAAMASDIVGSLAAKIEHHYPLPSSPTGKDKAQ